MIIASALVSIPRTKYTFARSVSLSMAADCIFANVQCRNDRDDGKSAGGLQLKPDEGQELGVNALHYLEVVLKKEFGFDQAAFDEEGMPRVVQFLQERGLILERVEDPLGVCNSKCGRMARSDGAAPSSRLRHSSWKLGHVGNSPTLCWQHYNALVRVPRKLLQRLRQAANEDVPSSSTTPPYKRPRRSGIAARGAEVANSVAFAIKSGGITTSVEMAAVVGALQADHARVAGLLLATPSIASVTEDGITEFCSRMITVLERDGISQAAKMQAKAQLLKSMTVLFDDDLPAAVKRMFSRTVTEYAKKADGHEVERVTHGKRGPKREAALAHLREFLLAHSDNSAHLVNAAGVNIRILWWSHAHALFLAYSKDSGLREDGGLFRSRAWVFAALHDVIRGNFHWKRQHNCLCELCAEAHELRDRLQVMFARVEVGDQPGDGKVRETVAAHAEWLQHCHSGLRTCLAPLADGAVHSSCVDHCVIRMFGDCDECDDNNEPTRCWACSKFHTVLKQLREDFPVFTDDLTAILGRVKILQAHFVDSALHEWALHHLDVRVGLGEILKVIADYKNRPLPQRAHETQQQWFGKKGMTGLGIALVYPGYDCADVDITMLYDIKGSEATQASPDALAALKVWLTTGETAAKLRDAGCAIVVDNAYSFHCAAFLVGATELLLRHGIFEIEFFFCCPGHGKTTLDGHFGVMGGRFKSWVAGGNDLLTPFGLHRATQVGGGCASAVFEYAAGAEDMRGDVPLPALPMGVRYARVVPVDHEPVDEVDVVGRRSARSSTPGAAPVFAESESSSESGSDSDDTSFVIEDEEEEDDMGTARRGLETRAAAARRDTPACHTRRAARQAVEYKVQCFMNYALRQYEPVLEIANVTAPRDAAWTTPPGVEHAHVAKGEDGSEALAGVGQRTQEAKIKRKPGCAVPLENGDGVAGEWAIFDTGYVGTAISKQQTELTIDMDVKCLFVWWLSTTYVSREGQSWGEIETLLGRNPRGLISSWLQTPITAAHYKSMSGNDIRRFKDNQLSRMCVNLQRKLKAAIAAGNVEAEAYHIPGRGRSGGIIINAEGSPYNIRTADD